jgi:predicted Fe-Mo cluster-binding NifX family protein
MHFGSAPAFAFVDSDTGKFAVVPNGNRHHQHGSCRPLEALAGQDVEAVVVGGVGPGALAALNAAGVAVYRAEGGTVREAIDALRGNALRAVTPVTACGHHGHGHALAGDLVRPGR